jgi:hypothetical protein
MATAKQRAAARRNIKKAQQAAKRKRTIAHLPKKTRTALGKEGAKAAKGKRKRTRLIAPLHRTEQLRQSQRERLSST